jgi:hypothetical protein
MSQNNNKKVKAKQHERILDVVWMNIFALSCKFCPTPDECPIFSSFNSEGINCLNEHIYYTITKDELSRCIQKIHKITKP